MSFYFLIFALIASAFCQEEYGCEDVCPCGNMTDTVTFSGDYVYNEQDGCLRTITCRPGGSAGALQSWTNTEIPKPADAFGSYFYPSTSGAPNVPRGAYMDFFAFFGIVCENSVWYITKYPLGISYSKVGGGNAYTGATTAYDGMKTKVSTIIC